MKNLKKYYKPILICLSAVGGTTIYYNNSFITDKKNVFASWTTNYTPSDFAKWDDNWDQSPNSLVHPKKLLNKSETQISNKLEKLQPSATRHVILIRHGQYELDGITDNERKLTNLGRKQAEQTGKRLRELGFPYTEMIKSTMKRAQETGLIISSHLPQVPVRECNFLREGAPVPPEPPVGHWKAEVHFYQDGARIEAAFRQYFHRASPEQEKDTFTLLVCHANVIRYFVCRALQFPPEGWLRFSLNHASITWISITPSGRVVLRALGDSGHMPPGMLTMS